MMWYVMFLIIIDNRPGELMVNTSRQLDMNDCIITLLLQPSGCKYCFVWPENMSEWKSCRSTQRYVMVNSGGL